MEDQTTNVPPVNGVHLRKHLPQRAVLFVGNVHMNFIAVYWIIFAFPFDWFMLVCRGSSKGDGMKMRTCALRRFYLSLNKKKWCLYYIKLLNLYGWELKTSAAVNCVCFTFYQHFTTPFLPFILCSWIAVLSHTIQIRYYVENSRIRNWNLLGSWLQSARCAMCDRREFWEHFFGVETDFYFLIHFSGAPWNL